MDLPISYNDVKSAAEVLDGLANRTPVMTSRSFNSLTGAEVFFKCENFQRVGAFKFRGGANALSRLDDDSRKRGVLTWSSGNHAQAISLASSLLGIPACIVMPDDAPKVKLEATRAYGAEVFLYNREEVTREELGTRIARERGLTIIPPYDHPHVAAGQGTAAKELFEEVGALDVLLVPVGGGGLLSGSALAAKELSPGCKVIGVEPAGADDAARSFRSGKLETAHNPKTIADGARTPSLGANITFPVIKELVADIVTVEDARLIPAMYWIWERMKIIIEPTCALPVAAAMDSLAKVAGLRVGIILSGGNVDLRKLPFY